MREILFKDVAHLYVGCKCNFKNHEGVWFIDTFSAFRFSMADMYGGWGNSIAPLLRPFSDITKEECIEYLSFYGDGKYLAHKGAEILVEFHDDTHFIPGPWQETITLDIENFEPINRVVWMLSKHFDLFSFIETGQAIDATTLPVNPYKG